MEQIRNNFQAVIEKIESACHRAGRQPKDVKLVVVTKGQPLERIQAVIEAGARQLGENYADEAIEKMPALAGTPDLEWHMIGHVQSRKARLVCEHFAWMHSLDSLKLATRLNLYSNEIERKIPVLIECNVSGEESKYGYPAWSPEQWPHLVEELKPILALSWLDVRGLMTMAPFSIEPEEARIYFRSLHELRDKLGQIFPEGRWEELSMGMSMDFEAAIQEGATIIRVGEAILGPRVKRGE